MKTPRLLIGLVLGYCASVVPAHSAQTDANAVTNFENEVRKLGFGGGVAAIYTFGDASIENASVDANGILRVETKGRARVGGILEAHFLFSDMPYVPTAKSPSSTQRKALSAIRAAPEDGSAMNLDSVATDIAHGPMVTVEFGENVIRSFGLGYMVSMRRFDVTTDSSGKYVTIKPRGVAFNLGLSLLVEPNVKSLDDGFEANMPLPFGTDVRFKEETRLGCALIFSAGF